MKKMKARTLRTIVTFAVLVLVAVGYFTAWGIGNLSGFGWDAFSVLCPLGYLESLVASKTFVPRAFLSFVLVIVAIVLLGRVFCAWICPMPTLQRLIPGVKLGSKKRAAESKRAAAGSEAAARYESELSESPCTDSASEWHEKELSESDLGQNSAGAARIRTFRTVSSESGYGKSENVPQDEPARAEVAAAEVADGTAAERADAAAGERAVPGKPAGRARVKFDSRFGVLLGALASAAIFGFPVFCLICPVGLTFATVLLVMRLFAFGDVTWAVVAVPLVLLVEVVFLRKWCGKFCPLGALISLVSGANRTLRPHVDNASCLFTSKGKKCFACSKACPEHIDVRRPELSESAAMNCTKCRECADACPAHAITFPVLPKAEEPATVATAEQKETQSR